MNRVQHQIERRMVGFLHGVRRVAVAVIDDVLLLLVSLRRGMVGQPELPEELPPIEPPSAPTPPGIPLAWDVAISTLNTALGVIDQLDTKAGVVIGALVLFGGVLLSAAPNLFLRILVGVPLILSVGFATLSFLVRRYEDAPDPARFASAALYEPDYMKEAFLGNVLEAVRVNLERGAKKGLYLNTAVGIGAAMAIGAVIVKVIGG